VGLSQPQRVCLTGVGDGLSDGEGVVATFFLISYQSVLASRIEINFARQSEDRPRTTGVKRLDIREILGTKAMGEITLK